MWLRVYNHDLGIQLYNVCLEYSGYASHFLFHARLVTYKSAKKWNLMRMCISRLCPFNSNSDNSNFLLTQAEFPFP